MKRKKKKQPSKNGVIGRCKKEDKVIYMTPEYANKAITLMFGMVNFSLNEYKDLHSYPCEHCKGYHVGHKSFYQMKLSREHAQIQQPQAQVPS